MRTLRRLGMLLALLSASALSAQEVLVNPGFEELDAEGQPVGWEVAEGCKVLGAAHARSGDHAVEVSYQKGLRQTIQVQPGETYRVTGYTCTPPNEKPVGGRVLTRWLDAEGRKVHGNSDYYHTAGTHWTRFSHVLSIPDGCVQIHLVVDGPYQTEDWFRFLSNTTGGQNDYVRIEFTPTLQKHLVGRTSKSVAHEFNINARPFP